jgi:adenylate cyclase
MGVDDGGDGRHGGMTAPGLACGSCGTSLSATAKFCSQCGAALGPSTQSAEYKQVTVLFADVVHSMDIAAAVGAERLREIMTELVNRTTAVVQRYGGTVNQFTGDGIMALFGAPMALEDHAVLACRAALGIQKECALLAAEVSDRDGLDLALRVGLNSGQVIAGEVGSTSLGYTTIGEQVGMAQRMESVAPPGGVILSQSTARLVDGVAALDEPEFVHIKGADEPIAAQRLLGMGEQHRAARRAESNLVGRRWEMSAVEGLLDRAVDGHGAVVGVVGPPGIGKSRLVREVAGMAARRGVEVFTAFCESHTSQVPFHVVTRLLRAATGVEGLDARAARTRIRAEAFDAEAEDVLLFDDLLGIADPDTALPKIDPDARRRRLTAMVNAASLANETPAVYVVEDAHWIDEVSESMLADFLAVVPQTPLLTLITYRPEYRGALAQVPGAQTIALAPLSDPETAALVSELLGPDPSVGELGQTIAERAAGTPFFAEEIVRELAERGVLQGKPGAYLSTEDASDVSVPATLQATIAARIDRLDQRSKRTLSAASVVGSRFGLDLLTVLGVEPVVADLVAAQLIDQVRFTRQPEYVFHHPLIRAVAYEAQLKVDRADLHRRVAAAIEQSSAGSVDEKAALIAEHLEAAGDLHSAFHWHMRAGAWSNNRDIAAARISWDRARHIADALPHDDPDRTAMGISPRTILCATGWRVHANDSGVRFEELRELCAVAGDKASLAIGMMGPLAEHIHHGEVREGSRLASEQMALLDSIGDPSLIAAAFGGISLKAQTGEMADVRRWSQDIIDWADGDPSKGNLMVGSPLAVALALRGITRWWQGRPGWREDLDEAFAIAEQSAEPLTLALVVSWNYGLGVLTGVLRGDHAVVRTVETALRITEASGDDYAVGMVWYVLGCVLLLRDAAGDRDRGRELLAKVRNMCMHQRFPLSELTIIDLYAGRELAKDGDRDGAIRVLRKSVGDLFTRGQVTYCVPAAGVLVETLLDGGADADVAEAEAAVARLAAAPADGSVIREVWLLRMRALLAKTRDDEPGYRDYRDRYRALASSLGFERHVAWAEAMP